MTFRQVLDVLWQRRWIIVVVMLLAVAFGYLFEARQTLTYASSATVRLSQAATAASTGDGGPYDAILLDVDPEAISSQPVLKAAARYAHESDPNALGAHLTTSVIEGARSNKIQIDTIGSTPEQARNRANALARAFSDYVDKQVSAGMASLKKQRAAAQDDITNWQNRVKSNPANQVFTYNLDTALSTEGDLQREITSVGNAGTAASVLTPAAPGARQQTSPSVVYVLALVTGLLAGIGIALLRDQFDDRIRTEPETEGLSGLPSLGELAVDRRRQRDRAMVATATSVPTAFSESIRALRTSLQVLTTPRKAVVVITSPEPGDGKTLVAANLAVSWARTGKSVVIVSGDLRRARLTTYFGEAADGPGLADLLRADELPTKSSILELLRATAHENLRILPDGEALEDPADLLATQAFERVMTHLRDLADVIIVDTPPAAALADAAIVASYADGVVVLTSLGRTKRATLVETIRALRGQGATIFGTVSNMSRRRLPKSYRAYGLQSRGRLRSTGGAHEAGRSDRAGLTSASPVDRWQDDEVDEATTTA